MRRPSEQLLLQAGVVALNTRGLDGLRRVLAPEALEVASADGGQPRVSRHSAYRLWPNRDQAVVDIARHVLHPGARIGVTSALAAYQAAVQDHARGQQTAGLGKDQLRGIFQQALKGTFYLHLASEERLAAWLLQIAATTSSPLWKHPPDRHGADYKVGREILEARLRCNEAAIAEWTVLLQGAMALFGRCPRPGYTELDIVQLMGAMFDGSLLRLFIDPHVVALDEHPTVHQPALSQAITRACDAMFEIAWSCTQPGLLADPRRPTDPHDPRTRTFDRLVHQAAVICQRLKPGQMADLRDVASDSGEPQDLAEHLFPEPGDLPDSVLRHLVKQHGEPKNWDIDDAAPWITSTLRALSDIATSHPAVVAAVADHIPHDPAAATGFVGELTCAITGLLQGSRSLHSDNPPAEARHLVTLALEGPPGWYGANAALERAANQATSG